MSGQKRTKLTAKQMQVAEMLANPNEAKTKCEIVNECGIARSTLYKWLIDDDFVDYVNKLVDRYTSGELSEVWRALCNRAKTGDVQAIKLFFELKGKYKNQVELSGNITFIDDVNE